MVFADQSGNLDALWSLLPWAGFIGAAALAGLGIALAIRRRLFPRKTEGSLGGFTLDEIRRLRDRGDVTIEEYEALRNRIIGTFRKGDGDEG